ncbi:hypothetical protein COP2_045268 [Malus domestica]
MAVSVVSTVPSFLPLPPATANLNAPKYPIPSVIKLKLMLLVRTDFIGGTFSNVLFSYNLRARQLRLPCRPELKTLYNDHLSMPRIPNKL